MRHSFKSIRLQLLLVLCVFFLHIIYTYTSIYTINAIVILGIYSVEYTKRRGANGKADFG